eukprot:3413922-Amphidinium_carterae.1
MKHLLMNRQEQHELLRNFRRIVSRDVGLVADPPNAHIVIVAKACKPLQRNKRSRMVRGSAHEESWLEVENSSHSITPVGIA